MDGNKRTALATAEVFLLINDMRLTASNEAIEKLTIGVAEIDSFIVHYTYGCGNDNLMGQVSEPATILLSGLGLFGLGILMRKRFIK